MPARARHLDASVAAIVAAYENGETCHAIGLAHNVGETTIRRLLSREGVALRSPALRHRRYPLNDDAFAELDGETAYWLGMLITDGGVVGNRVTLSLARVDEGHCRELARFLGCPERPLNYLQDRNEDRAALRVRSDRLTADLARWGITERKTFTACAHPQLELSIPFWRGVIDGDGTIRRRDRTVSLYTASSALLAQYERFLAAYGLPAPRIHRDGSTLEAALQVAPSQRLLQLLYSGAGPALARKQQLALLSI